MNLLMFLTRIKPGGGGYNRDGEIDVISVSENHSWHKNIKITASTGVVLQK